MKYLALFCFTLWIITSEICLSWIIVRVTHDQSQLQLGLEAIGKVDHKEPPEKDTRL